MSTRQSLMPAAAAAGSGGGAGTPRKWEAPRIRRRAAALWISGYLPAPAPEEQVQGVRGGGPLFLSLCPHQRRRSACKECGGASICQHQRERSKCKECRAEADELIPDGLEELGQGVGAGQNRRTANPISTLSFPQDHVTHGRQV